MAVPPSPPIGSQALYFPPSSGFMHTLPLKDSQMAFNAIKDPHSKELKGGEQPVGKTNFPQQSQMSTEAQAQMVIDEAKPLLSRLAQLLP